jgi:hypothetical protein
VSLGHYGVGGRGNALFCRRWGVSGSRIRTIRAAGSTSYRCFCGSLVDASLLPAAEADARAFGFPFDTPVRVPSGDDGRGRARARKHLVTGESHGRAAGLRNEGTVASELVVQRLVRVLGPGPGRPGVRAFSTVNSPSISLALAVIPSFFTCKTKTGEDAGEGPDAAPAPPLPAVAAERRMFTPRTGRTILAWVMKYSISETSASGSGSGAGAAPLMSRDRLAWLASVMKRLSR